MGLIQTQALGLDFTFFCTVCHTYVISLTNSMSLYDWYLNFLPDPCFPTSGPSSPSTLTLSRALPDPALFPKDIVIYIEEI